MTTTAPCACWWPTTRRSRASACCACLTAFPDVVIAGECADAHEVLRARARGRDRRRAARHPDAGADRHRGAAALSGRRAGRDLLHRAHRARHRRVRPGRDRLPAQADRGRAAAQRAGAGARARRRRRYREELARLQSSAQAAAPLRAAGAADATGDRAGRSRDVSHAALDGELVSVHTAAGTYLSALSLQELEARLPGGSSRAFTGARW